MLASLISGSPKTRWSHYCRFCLLPHLCADVMGIVVAYAANIECNFLRAWGSRGTRDFEMQFPFDVCTKGNELFLADSGNHRVVVFDQATGKVIRLLKGLLKDQGVIAPYCLAIRDDELFIGDYSDIRVFDMETFRFRRMLAGTNVRQVNPYGLALFNDYIFTCGYNNDLLVCSIQDGRILRSIGNKGIDKLEFHGPRHLRVDENELFVADCYNNRIQVLDVKSNMFLRQYNGTDQVDNLLLQPYSMLPYGHEVIVCDTSNSRLVIFDRMHGTVQRSIREECTAYGQFVPTDITKNARDEFFVCDYHHHRILVFQ